MVDTEQNPATYERPFNVPNVVLILLGICVGVHVVRNLVSTGTNVDIILLFSFIPARFSSEALQGEMLPGGELADLWTFITYAFLHGDITHLLVNGTWMLAFGSPVAWRFGAGRFLLFSAITAIAGAATHLLLHAGEVSPLVGASAAISGYMAAATRFVFQPGAPLGLFRIGGSATFKVPALSLLDALRDSRVVGFLVVWFVMNLVFGLGAIGLSGDVQSIAWEAHIGGFLAGLLLFPFFDPVRSP